MMLRLPAERAIVRTVYEEARSLHANSPGSNCAKWHAFNSAGSSSSLGFLAKSPPRASRDQRAAQPL